MKDITKKTVEHKLIITQAEKEKFLVTIHEQEYNKIVNEFICKIQFTRITQDPIKQHQSNIK
jgi:DNA-binding sugar fermentation-stimulating protein